MLAHKSHIRPLVPAPCQQRVLSAARRRLTSSRHQQQQQHRIVCSAAAGGASQDPYKVFKGLSLALSINAAPERIKIVHRSQSTVLSAGSNVVVSVIIQ